MLLPPAMEVVIEVVVRALGAPTKVGSLQQQQQQQQQQQHQQHQRPRLSVC